MKTWIQTYTGKQFDIRNPDPAMVDIYDIAHALSNQCRFTGHSSEFYSVAQHSVRVSYLVPLDFAAWALLHDASEAYLSDISTPVKKLPELRAYRDLEKKIQNTIYQKFMGGLPSPEAAEAIRVADHEALIQEYQEFIYIKGQPSWGTEFETPKRGRILANTATVAKAILLERFNRLLRGKAGVA